MRFLISLVVCSQFLLAGSAFAKPTKWRNWDVAGTTFIVTVDWDTNFVSARLTRNPAKLTGAALEQSMQMAVYYASSVDCKMLETGRKKMRRNEVVGTLHCPWF